MNFKKFTEKPQAVEKEIEKLREKMRKLSLQLEFEDAAKVRDEIKRLQIMQLGLISGDTEKQSHDMMDKVGQEKKPKIGEKVKETI